MSTRSQILITDKEFNSKKLFKITDPLIYRHSDGYPEGVIPEILPFIKSFISKRGFDAEYMRARLVQYLTNLYDNNMELFAKSENYKDFFIKNQGVLGYGIDNVFHSDIEYLYVVTKDQISIYEVLQWESSAQKINLKEVIKL